MRHAIRRTPLLRPLLALFGATSRSSFIDVAPNDVRFKLGFFDLTIPRYEIARAAPGRWPWLGGLGWRIGPGLGLVGSYEGVVEIELITERDFRILLVPWRDKRIFVSLEDPQAFLADLGARA